MDYKEGDDLTKEKKPGTTTDFERLEELVVERFDELYPRLQASYVNNNLLEFESICNVIFNQLNGKYPLIFHHIIEVGFIEFIVEQFLAERSDFTKGILLLIVGICNTPDHITTSYLLNSAGFTQQLNEYIHTNDDQDIFCLSFAAYGSLLYDCQRLHVNLPIQLDSEILQQYHTYPPEWHELALRTFGYIMDDENDPNVVAEIISNAIKLIRKSIKLNVILDSFKKAVTKWPELCNVLNTQDFITEVLIDIASPMLDTMEEIKSSEEYKTNALYALRLLHTMVIVQPTIGTLILNNLPYDYLVNMQGKDQNTLALVFKLITLAIPARKKWLIRLLLDHKVIFTIPKILQDTPFNLRLSVIEMINIVFEYAEPGLHFDLVTPLLVDIFIEQLIEFVQSDQYILVKQVIVTIQHMCEIAFELNPRVIACFKCDEIMDTFSEILADTSIPQEDKPINEMNTIEVAVENAIKILEKN